MKPIAAALLSLSMFAMAGAQAQVGHRTTAMLIRNAHHGFSGGSAGMNSASMPFLQIEHFRLTEGSFAIPPVYHAPAQAVHSHAPLQGGGGVGE